MARIGRMGESQAILSGGDRFARNSTKSDQI